jgi:phage-related tail fiber protein
MSEAITTNDYRKRLARHMYDNSALPKVAKMAFGDGGHNPDGTPKTPNPNQTQLNHEILRKTLTSIFQEDEYSVTGKGTISKIEAVGVSISEAGLLDEAGNLVGFKNFAPKIKESDETYEISIKLKF